MQNSLSSQVDRPQYLGRGGFTNPLVFVRYIGEPAPCILKDVDCDLPLGGGGFMRLWVLGNYCW